MKLFFWRIVIWFYIRIHSFLIRIGIGMRNAEIDLLDADSNKLKKGSWVQRMIHRNPVIEKFYAGQRDEKYMKDYYELLKKADNFIRNTTPHKIGVTADKHRLNYGKKDRFGRRYEHYGFFDNKHKNAGKTMGEVLDSELEERRTTDDEYEILHIFNNQPIEVGLAKIFDVVTETKKEIEHDYEVADIEQKSKTFKFPIRVNREKDVNNKIEQLTDYLHIKKIGFNHRQLEFFIPLKFKVDEIEDGSNMFKELIDIDVVKIMGDYGDFMSFRIDNYVKRIIYNNTHEVWKFDGIEMADVGLEKI